MLTVIEFVTKCNFFTFVKFCKLSKNCNKMLDNVVKKAYNLIKLKESRKAVKGEKEMTKAERIYKDTKWECRKYIEAWGYEEGMGFNSLETEECVYKRTANEINKLIEREAKDLKLALELGVVELDDKAMLKINTLKMVKQTLKNSWIA